MSRDNGLSAGLRMKVSSVCSTRLAVACRRISGVCGTLETYIRSTVKPVASKASSYLLCQPRSNIDVQWMWMCSKIWHSPGTPNWVTPHPSFYFMLSPQRQESIQKVCMACFLMVRPLGRINPDVTRVRRLRRLRPAVNFREGPR